MGPGRKPERWFSRVAAHIVFFHYKGDNVRWFLWSIFFDFLIIIVCFVADIYDLVHDVDAIFRHP